MLRRSLCFLLAFVMVMGMLPVNAMAEDEPVITPTEEITAPAVEETTAPAEEETTAPVEEEEATEPVEEEATAPAEEEETTAPVEEEATAPAEEEETTAPVEEETTAPTEEETTAPTEEEATTPAEEEEATEPVEEETTTPTEEETTAPVEEETTAPDEEEIAQLNGSDSDGLVEPIFIGPVYLPGYSEEDIAARLDSFAAMQFFGKSGSLHSVQAGEKLPKFLRLFYSAAKAPIAQIAAGQRSSTVVTIDLTANGYNLGNLPQITTDDLGLLIAAWESDLPYEMYWFLGVGLRYQNVNGKLMANLLLYPATNYCPDDYDPENPTIIVTEAAKAVTASNNAKSIVAQYAGYTDYNKLAAYADKICSLVEYDHDAANNQTWDVNINPWTLVNVFDNDPTTNVVCEGYSEAFQYLCNSSTFQGDVECYSVSGNGHKWNIVRISGISYIMDVTNCDYGNYAYRGSIFLGGCSGSVEAGYRLAGFHYWYYDEIKTLYGTGDDSILKLSPTKFDPSQPPLTMTQAQLEQALTDARGGSYTLKSKVTLSSDLTVENVALTIGSKGSIQAPSGTVVKVQQNASLAIQTGGSLVLDSGAVLVARGSMTGTPTGSGQVYTTDRAYLDYLADNAGTLTADRIRRELAEMDLLEAMQEALTADDGLFQCLTTLEAACGGPAAVTVAPEALDAKDIGFTVLGANLNLPTQASTPIKLGVEEPFGTMGGFRLTLTGTEAPVLLAFPVCLTLTLPAALQQGRITLYRVMGDSLVELASVTDDASLRFVTDTLGDFVLKQVFTGSCGAALTYTLQDGVLTISGTGAMENFAFDVYGPWHDHRSEITSVVIGEGVTSIGIYAFHQFANLTSITIPASVTSIGGSAFDGCASLASITIPGGVTSIKNNTFCGCSNLASITIPQGVTSIGSTAFSGCSSLTTLTLPEGVTRIGDSAFRDCSGLTSLTIPAGVTSLGEGAFEGCSGLTSVTIPQGITAIQIGTFLGCSSLSSVTIPEGVTSIGPGAFYGCSSLSAVTIPESVSTIWDIAFENCSGLTSITIPEGVTSIGDGAFNGCSSLETVRYGGSRQQWDAIAMGQQNEALLSATILFGRIEGSCGEGLHFELKNGVLTISGTGAMDDYLYEEYAPWYDHRSEITTVVLTEGVTSIGSEAFEGCSSLTVVTIPEGVTRIGDSAFCGCSSLVSVTIPQGVTSIADSTFVGCTSLASLSIPQGVTSIGSTAFWNCTSLISVTLPDSVTSIGDFAFWDCTSLTSVTIPAGVTSIGSGAFLGCSSLTAVNIPEGITTIEICTFFACTSLASITIPEGVTSIERDAFYQCSSLTAVTIPESVATIGDCAFDSCYGLTSVTLSAGVTSIGEGAFKDCSSLANVFYCGTQEQWEAIDIGTDNDDLLSASIHCILSGGSCGTNLTYTLQAGVLTISGSGPMTQYASWNDVPWSTLADQITTLVLSENMTTISPFAFRGCTGLTTVTIPYRMSAIGAQAFYDCTGLTTVRFLSDGIPGDQVFNTNLKAYYPQENPTWTKAIRSSYGTGVTWVGMELQPGLVSSKLTLNSALTDGVELGLREAVDNPIHYVQLFEYNTAAKAYADTPSTRFLTDGQTLRTNGQVSNGTYKLRLVVSCHNGKNYLLDIQVKVVNSLPSVTVKQTGKFNLFYLDSQAGLTLTAPAGIRISSVRLVDTDHFILTEEGKLHYSQTFLDAPVAKPDTKATLEIQLEGYQVPVRKAVTISTVTTAPKLVFTPASSVINTKLTNSFVTHAQVLNQTTGEIVNLSQCQLKANAPFATLTLLNNAVIFELKEAKGGSAGLTIKQENWLQPIKITHKITVSKNNPTVTISKGTLVLDRLLPDGEQTAVVSLNQANLAIRSVTITPDSRSAGEAAKLHYEFRDGAIHVSIADESNLPKAGTYTFRCQVTLDNEAGTKLADKTFKVQVKTSAPAIKLKSSTLKLNKRLGTDDLAQTTVTAACPAGYVLQGLRAPEGLEGIHLEYSPDEMILSARLTNTALKNQTKTIKLVPVLRRLSNNALVALEDYPVTVKVQLYDAAPSVTLTPSGKLDAIIPGSAITYTVKPKNLNGTPEAVALQGTDAHLFRVQLENGKVKLTIAEGAQCKLKTTYRPTLVLTILGRTYEVALSFQVTQSSLKLTAPTTMVYFRHQTAPITGTITLQTPTGAAIDQITLGEKTDATLRKAIGDGSLTISSSTDGRSQVFRLSLTNPQALTQGKSYALYLDVVPMGSALGANPTSIKITVSIR